MNAMNEKISAIGVVPVIKLNHPARDAAGLARALCAGEVPVAEVTFRAAGAEKAIRIMKETCPDMLVGAGTVTNTAQIDAVLAAGLAKIKALAAPFPMFKVMPTGGISLKNLKEYLSSPVIAACGGSYMVTADLIDNNKWDEITELCRKSREIVAEARA